MREDWVSPWWQAACLPDEWDVCGFTVPSLSVWHVFALENLGNPYACGGAIDKDAVACLLLVASNDRAGGRRLLLDAKYRKAQMKRVHRRIKCKSMDDLHAACAEYVDTCMRAVSRWKKGDSKPCGVPIEWHLVCTLSRCTGGDLDAAWDTPYAVARCLCDAAAEQNGDDSIMSPQAQEMEDNWPEYERQAQEAAKN